MAAAALFAERCAAHGVAAHAALVDALLAQTGAVLVVALPASAGALSDSHVRALCETLCVCAPRLERLCLVDSRAPCLPLSELVLRTGSPALTRLSLEGGRLGDGGCVALADALAVNFALQRLDVSRNDIGAAGAEALAATLELNETLVQVSFARNRAGAAGAAAFARMLGSNATLRVLDLSHNALGPAGAEALRAALERNTTLQKLYLKGNDAPASAALVAAMPAPAPSPAPSPAPAQVRAAAAAPAPAPVFAPAFAPSSGLTMSLDGSRAPEARPDWLVGRVLAERFALDAVHASDNAPGAPALFRATDITDGKRVVLWLYAGVERAEADRAMCEFIFGEAGEAVALCLCFGCDSALPHRPFLVFERPFFLLADAIARPGAPGAADMPEAVAAQLVAVVAALLRRGLVHGGLDTRSFGRFSRDWRLVDSLTHVSFDGTAMPQPPLSLATPPEHAHAACPVVHGSATLWRLGMVLLQLLAPHALSAHAALPGAFLTHVVDAPAHWLPLDAIADERQRTRVAALLQIDPAARRLLL